MILEMVVVQVRTGMGADYERVFNESAHLIAACQGYLGHRLLRCIEVRDKFVVLVHWQRLDDHVAFNQAPQYQLWKSRIHPFYAAPSVVKHFHTVAEGGTSS